MFHINRIAEYSKHDSWELGATKGACWRDVNQFGILEFHLGKWILGIFKISGKPPPLCSHCSHYSDYTTVLCAFVC